MKLNCNSEELLGNKVKNGEMSHLFTVETSDKLLEWQEEFQTIYRKQLGVIPKRADLSLQMLEQKDCGSYFRQRITYQSEEGYVVIAPDLRASLLGSSLVGLNICDLQVALDVLESLDYVKSNSIEWAKRLVARVKLAYKACGKSENLQIAKFSGYHEFEWEQANKQFKKYCILFK